MNRKEVALEITRMIEDKVGDVFGDGFVGTMLSWDILEYLESVGYTLDVPFEKLSDDDKRWFAEGWLEQEADNEC